MSSPLHTLKVVAHKDLLRFFADRRGALLALLMPVILGALLGGLFKPDALSGKVPLIVVDADGGSVAKAIVASLEASGRITVTPRPEAEARAQVGAGASPAMLVLPEGLSAALSPERLLAQPRPEVALIYDPARAAERAMAEGVIRRALVEAALSQVASPAGAAGAFKGLGAVLKQAPFPEGRKARWAAFLAEGASLLGGLEGEGGVLALGLEALPPPATLSVAPARQEGGGAYHPYAHTFAGMLCQFLMFIAAGLARALIAERRDGALLRVRLAPARPGAALAGTGLATVFIAVLASALLYAVAILGFGVQINGSVPGFGLVLLGQAIFIGGFALLLAGLGHTERQVETLGTLVILALSFVGGAWIPSFLMPAEVQLVGMATPTWWATHGLAAMTWRGMGISAALLPAGVLTLWGLACGVIGARVFRWP